MNERAIPPENESTGARNAAAAAAAALVALPFLSNLPTDYDRLAPMLAVLPALWLGRRALSRNGVGSKADRTDAGLLAVALGVGLISALASERPWAALTSSAAALWAVVGAVLGRRVIATEARFMRWLLAGIAASAAFGGAAVWIQWRSGSGMGGFPHYGHVRLLGLHMMLGTLAGLGWLIQTRAQSVERLLAFVVALIACGGLLWSGGRTPLVGAAGGVAVWLWFAPSGTRRILLLALPLVGLGGLLLSCAHWAPDSYLGWWSAISRSREATTLNELSSNRGGVWQLSWSAFLESPWWGHGSDFYRFIVPKQDGNQPHNWPLQFLLHYGVLGTVPLSVLLVRQPLRGLLHAGSEGLADRRTMQTCAAAVGVAFLVAGMFDGVFYHAITLVPAAMLMGVAGMNRAEESPRAVRDPWTAFRWLLVPASLLLLWHTTVLASLLNPPAPPRPDSLWARAVRAAPTTTFGIQNWLNEWRATGPDAVLEWLSWATRHHDNPAQLHAYAAVIHANRKDFEPALREVDLALSKAHVGAVPNLRRLQQAIHNAQSKPAPVQTDDR